MIGYLGAKTNQFNTAVTALNAPPVTTPAVQVGDFVLVTISMAHATATVTPPAGWTQVGGYHRSGNVSVCAFWAFHTAVLSYAFVASVATAARVTATTYLGVHPTAPIHTIGTSDIVAGGGSTTMSMPAIATTVPSVMAVSIAAAVSTVSFSQVDLSSPLRQRAVTAGVGSPPIPFHAVGDRDVASAGSGGGGSAVLSQSGSTNRIGWTFGLEPDPNAAPFVRDWKELQTHGAMMPAHEIGDHLLCMVSTYNAGASITMVSSGWSLLHSYGEQNGSTFALYTRVADSSSVPYPALTIGGGWTPKTTVYAIAGTSGLRASAANQALIATTIDAPSVASSSSDLALMLFQVLANYGWSVAPASVTVESNANHRAVRRVIAGAVTGTTTMTHAGQTQNTARAITLSYKTLNRAPSAPGIPSVAPNPVNTNGTISWTAGTDPDGDALTYEIDISTNNGSTWSNLYGAASGVSQVYNFAGQPSTTTARIRIRSKDSAGLVSAWSTSAVFTIQHNVAPTAPSLGAPADGSTIDRTAVNRFHHTFNDPDVGDTQSKVDFEYRLVGAPTWTTYSVTHTAHYVDIPANTFALGNYERRVWTYDAQGVKSTAPSATGFFTAANPPASAVITAPANNATIATANGEVSWSYPTQAAYEVRRVKDTAGVADPTTIYMTTGVIENVTDRNRALLFDVNNRYEHVQVRVRDTNGLWTTWTSIRVNVAYTPPMDPVLIVYPVQTETVDGIELQITNPAPAGSAPLLERTEVWRREVGRPETEMRIKHTVAPGGIFTDHRVASGVDYEYRSVAIGINGTSTSTAWVSGD